MWCKLERASSLSKLEAIFFNLFQKLVPKLPGCASKAFISTFHWSKFLRNGLLEVKIWSKLVFEIIFCQLAKLLNFSVNKREEKHVKKHEKQNCPTRYKFFMFFELFFNPSFVIFCVSTPFILSISVGLIFWNAGVSELATLCPHTFLSPFFHTSAMLECQFHLIREEIFCLYGSYRAGIEPRHTLFGGLSSEHRYK